MTNDVRSFVVRAIEDAGGLHTVADLAHRWGVTRARAHELSQQHGFPEPLLYMGKSAVYLGNEADEWRAQHRRTGRPTERNRVR